MNASAFRQRNTDWIIWTLDEGFNGSPTQGNVLQTV
jgi:hypothetical protein